MSYVHIESALNDYVNDEGGDPPPFLARTLASYLGWDRETMSTELSDYRYRQGRRNTPYVIACRGYGRSARWWILAMPGDDPGFVQQARVDAAKWSAQDMVDRVARDIVCELTPGLQGAAKDNAIQAATQIMRGAAENTVQVVMTMLNGTTPPTVTSLSA